MSAKEEKSLWNLSWELLSEAQNDAKKPFGTPVVATSAATGIPRTRTLVLRKALRENGELWCYTDRRSVKAQHLQVGHKVMAWTFWDPYHQLQFSCQGPTTWLPDSEAANLFKAMPKHARKAYATLAPPGSPLAGPGDGLPADWEARTLEQTERAGQHFGVLCTRISRAEVLQLNRKGHRRLLATRGQSPDWHFTWLAP